MTPSDFVSHLECEEVGAVCASASVARNPFRQIQMRIAMTAARGARASSFNAKAVVPLPALVVYTPLQTSWYGETQKISKVFRK